MKNFDYANNTMNNGFMNPSMSMAKKSVPHVSMTKGPNHILWHEEEKLGRVNVNAFEYTPSYS